MMQNEFKERLKAFRESLKDPDLWSRYQTDLKEEGVKALLIVPILIECLGYNNLDDYIFENSQNGNQGFADIVLKDTVLLELKKFNLLADNLEREKAEKQIKKYIRSDKDKITYGVLTDGVIWELFIDKKYICLQGNENNDIPEIFDDCPLCCKFNISDDNFINLISMLNKEDIEDNIKKYLLRAIVGKAQAKSGKIALHKMFSKMENMDLQEILGNYMQQQVDEYFRIEKGDFFDDIQIGKVKIGSQISYEDEYIIIIGKIMQGGFIQIQPKECRIKMEKQPEAISKYPNITDLIFKTWPNSNDSCQYPTRIALIKEMTNSKSLHRQEEYIARFR